MKRLLRVLTSVGRGVGGPAREPPSQAPRHRFGAAAVKTTVVAMRCSRGLTINSSGHVELDIC